jgi:ABC-type polysaccharide/polyol phosphate transport system ATPase subunit
MTTPAIEFVSVSKRYNLSKQKRRSIQEILTGGFRRPKQEKESLWVLKDVSFTVQPGESVAFIGPNGAGKSTILKLISSIIIPTSGKIEINGRISSLLELGAGFHPDLTGRENIYLNGSILGLSRKEIDRKYDTIVEFAEMANYIDLPVKHYSSGMYLRLAFSVASHVEPDVLLIDEVIAVGDHIFKQRCLKRLAQLKATGVTLMLVSHATDLIQNFCQRAIWLEDGRIQEDGQIERVVETYLVAQYRRHVSSRGNLPKRLPVEQEQAQRQAGVEVNRWGSGEITIGKVEFLDAALQPQSTFHVAEPMIVRMHYQANEVIEDPVFGVAIHRADGLHLNGPNTKLADFSMGRVSGSGYVDYVIEALNLLPGAYELSAAVYDPQPLQAYDHQHRLYRFQILPGRVRESTGAVYLPSHWNHAMASTEQENSADLEKVSPS